MLQLSSPTRESLEQRLFTALDDEHGDAYRHLHLTVMLATRFATAKLRRKGHCVTVLYLHALGDARTPAGRKARWRRFMTTTASLVADLRRARTAPHHPTRQAQAELESIVAENADLVPWERR
ncbi:MAG TPA: hypothetical protein VMA36_11400 [Candidatus Limnocylindria bacterium]|jgi:hypothetical protein|nr:hypothetical protein [Candidatus Limnocylindria bacterium]